MYRQITELPLKHFVTVCVDEDLSVLIKQGQATDEELLEAWGDIQQQYADAIGGSEAKANLHLVKEVAILAGDCRTLELLIPLLRGMYVRQFADEVNRTLKTNFRFDITNLTEYDKLLDKCETRLKAIRLQYSIKEAQLNATQKEEKGTKPTREYFQNILISLSDYRGYPISPDITTYEFCHRVVTVSREMDKQKANGR